MHKSNVNQSTCTYGNNCTRQNLLHILTCHHKIFRPKCKSNGFNIGFHQTSPEAADKIAKEGFKPGLNGLKISNVIQNQIFYLKKNYAKTIKCTQKINLKLFF